MAREILGFRPFAFFLVLAIAAGWWAPLHLARREGYSGARVVAYLALLGLAAVLGAKVYSIVERGPFATLSEEITAGYRYPGGIVALVIAAPLLRFVLPAGLGVARVLDYMAPGIAFAAAVMRLDCLFVGCCTGDVCHLPWCLEFPRGSVVWNRHFDERLIDGGMAHSLAVHPLQIYFLVASAAVGWFLLRFEGRKSFDGQVVLLFLVLHEGAKFLLEFMRVPREPTVQMVSLGLALAGGLGLAIAARRRRGTTLAASSS